MANCPECGAELQNGAIFCRVCGCETGAPPRDKRGQLLLFSTPLALIAIGIAFAVDRGFPEPMDTGSMLGLSISMFFFVTAGSFWIFARVYELEPDSMSSWRAGMFGLGQIFAIWALSYPLTEGWLVERTGSLTFTDEVYLKLGTVFSLFLVTTLVGLYSLGIRLKYRGRGEEYPSPRHRTIGELGLVVIFLLTIGGAALLMLLLPGFKRSFVLARLDSDTGFHEAARRNLEDSIAQNASFAPALHLMGYLDLSVSQKGSPGKPIEWMTRAMDADPGNPRYRLGLSMAFEAAGKVDEAIAAASGALSLRPREAQILTQLADLYLRVDRREEAVDLYKRALIVEPEDPRSLNNLAFTLLELGKDLPQALDLARESVRRQPGAAYNIDTLAWALYKNGHVGEAFETMSEIRDVASQSPEIAFHFLMISKELGVVQDPRGALEGIYMRPDAFLDRNLRRQIGEAIASLPPVASMTPEAPPEKTLSPAHQNASGEFPAVFISPSGTTSSSIATSP